MEDEDVFERISLLVDEERRLREQGHPDEARIARVEEMLDQCWDLLRQRRARREYDQPDTAAVRDSDVVEGYEQ